MSARRSSFVSVAAAARLEARAEAKRRTLQRRAERALVAALRSPLAPVDATRGDALGARFSSRAS